MAFTAGTVVVGVCVLLFVVCLLDTMLGWRHRKRRFARRDALSANEWFDLFRVGPQWMRKPLIELLGELEAEIGVPWTKLRPEDSFPESLMLPAWLWEGDLDGFCFAQERWVKKHGIDPGAVPEPEVDTLGDYVTKMAGLLERYRQEEKAG